MSGANRMRASCERCRGQKLRCTPIPGNGPSAPCQRCVKANVADCCIFQTRSQSQRPPNTTLLQQRILRSADLDIPGTSLFSFTTTPSTSISKEHNTVHSPTSDSLSLTLHESLIARAGESTQLEDDLSMSIEALPDTRDRFPDGEVSYIHPWDSVMSKESHDLRSSSMSITSATQAGETLSQAGNTEAMNFPEVWGWDMFQKDQGTRFERMLNQERQDPLVELTSLLAEMAPYEQRLLLLENETVSDYPVGDALFFAHRFCAILTCNNTSRVGCHVSTLETPTVLLALSCFLTLSRVYSAIFKYLNGLLLRTSNLSTSPGGLADFSSYRGLRLGQLHQVCGRSESELIKSVTSILLESFRAAEDSLNLSPGVRVTNATQKPAQEGSNSRVSSINEGERGHAWEASSAIRVSALDDTVASQTKALSKVIKQVIDLLKDRG